MDRILVLGSGGHSLVVVDTIRCLYPGIHIALLDDNPQCLSAIGPLSLISSPDILSSFDFAFVAIGHPTVRQSLHSSLIGLGYSIPTIVHPRAYISPSSTLGMGTIVLSNSSVQSSASIGDGVIINNSVSIDHDTTVGSFAHICPGCNVAGGVTIGSRAWIGIGSCVIDHLLIADDVYVGAGSVVVDSLTAKCTAFGTPAKLTSLSTPVA